MLFALCSLMLVAAGNVVTLAILYQRQRWRWRREVQPFVLAAPLVGPGLALLDRGGCQIGACAFVGLGWLAMPERVLTSAAVLMAFAGLGVGLARLAVLSRSLTRASATAGPALRALVEHPAARFGQAAPRVLVRCADRPLALTYGLWRPTILLSSWMVTHLDPRELEAVIAHELAHAARRDFQVLWAATMLRDAFCYLPTSWVAYRQLQQETEPACDDLAIRHTNRPLGLASTLAKVWQQALLGSSLQPAQALVGPGEVLEGRITRLLNLPSRPGESHAGRVHTLSTSVAALAGLLLCGTVAVVLLLVVMGCGPTALAMRPL